MCGGDFGGGDAGGWGYGIGDADAATGMGQGLGFGTGSFSGAPGGDLGSLSGGDLSLGSVGDPTGGLSFGNEGGFSTGGAEIGSLGHTFGGNIDYAPSSPGFLGTLANIALPAATSILGAILGGPLGAIGGSVAGKGLAGLTSGLSPSDAIGKGLLGSPGTMASAMAPGLPGMALSGIVGSLTSDALSQSEGERGTSPNMADLGLGLGGASSPMNFMNPYTENTQTAPKSVAEITSIPIPTVAVPPSKSKMSNVMASRGIRGAGTKAPKSNWYT